MSEGTSPTFDEALRLVLAFYCIMEPEKREVIKALVRKYADRTRLEEAASGGPVREADAKPPAVPRQVEMLLRQRQYASHLKELELSVLEDAIDRLGR